MCLPEPHLHRVKQDSVKALALRLSTKGTFGKSVCTSDFVQSLGAAPPMPHEVLTGIALHSLSTSWLHILNGHMVTQGDAVI